MSSMYTNPYEWTSRKQYSDKSLTRTGEIRAFQELYGYYPPPDARLPSIEQDDEFIPCSKSCPISLEDDDEMDIRLEEDDLPLAVVHKYYVMNGIARKAPSAITTVNEHSKERISSPPRYHPSLSGKFLVSGPPPPRHLRPSADGKSSKPKAVKPKAIKRKSTKPKSSPIKPKSSSSSFASNKRSYIESDDEEDFIHESSYSKNKRARTEDSYDGDDEDFVVDRPFKPATQPNKAKKVKKARTYAKKVHPTTSGKQPITASKRPSELIRPALRSLPPCPDIQNITSKKGAKWVQYEHDALYFLVVQQRNKEVTGDLNIKPLMDMNLFSVMAEQLQSFNIFRTEGAARNYWNRYGREKAQWDERIDTWEGRNLVTCSQESKANNSA
ncbi:hypothetical protein ONS96_000194 [Cadophora gregata f. sp. sojae]|nr:hypothetical protein ONS96_000194 [Cadophora gregata f. sp. sojae]